jgi:organic radical activating enzyme
MIPISNEIRFEITTKCNYRCVICPREKLTRKIETMNFNLFEYLFDKILSETNQYNTVTFPGMGEPLLDETLDKKISYAKKKKFKVLLLTNGSLLTLQRFKRLQDLGIDSVRVSLYGDAQKTYNRVHGIKDTDLFRKIKDQLTQIAINKKNTRLLLTYNVIDGINKDNLNAWIEYWRDKADLIEVWRPHNWVDGRSYRGIHKKRLKTCGRPWKTPLQVQVDGTVNICCFDFDGKLLLGDLKTQPLTGIFNSTMFKKIIKHHISGDFRGSGLICEYCDQRNADKSDVMIYNSKFDIEERVKMVSTIYSKLI